MKITQIKNYEKIAILLCTYNGEKFLAEQLESINAQTHTHWEIHASDDGSQDGTLTILQHYQNRLGKNKLFIYKGPAKGLANNFFSLINNSEISADYYAYCDQDDIWQSDKLERAVSYFHTAPSQTPTLYCTSKEFINQTGDHMCYATLCKKAPSFANALIQNITSGNTMIINDAARSILKKTGRNINVYVHDWWTYLIITGCGGCVYYDSYPSVRYRQHGENVIGGSSGFMAKLKRIQMLFIQGSFKKWNDKNIIALYSIKKNLTTESQQILDTFKHARSQWLIPRMYGMIRSGVYRQRFLENIGFFIAILFNKI